MISITQHIEYLMLRNDCVVVPGWGALVASHTAANATSSHIVRPSRIICFNPGITHNDGTLATSLMRRHNLSYGDATKLIADNVTAFNRQLNMGSEVAFGRLGFFKLDDNRKLIFVPIANENSCDEFFGLHSFDFTPLSQLTDEDNAQHQVSQNIFSGRKFKVAASIATLIGIGLLLSTPVVVDKAAHKASLNIADVKTKPTTVKVTPVNNAKPEDNKFEVLENEPAAVASEKESAYNAGMPNDENATYFLVINSCKKQHQAQALIKQYAKKGIKARTIARGGYHHVVVAQSNSQQELIRAKKLLPEKYRKAWVCK